MIFATVGSISFDELVQALDDAIGRGAIKREVIIQIANGSYEPKHCEYFRTAPGLQPYFDRAELVISHGGATTMEVLERGIRLVSVSNPHLSDDHQREFLETMDRRGLTRYCASLQELPVKIEESLSCPPPKPLDLKMFFGRIAQELEGMSLAR